jgi:hypothetical protein
VIIRTDLGGDILRCNDSICASYRCPVRIAIKHLPGGELSNLVKERVKTADVLDLINRTAVSGVRVTADREGTTSRSRPEGASPPMLLSLALTLKSKISAGSR